MTTLYEDFSASHDSLSQLFGVAQGLALDHGVPEISRGVPYPDTVRDPRWDTPPAADTPQFYGLLPAPDGFDTTRPGMLVAFATRAPSLVIEFCNLQDTLHKQIPDAAAAVALRSSLVVVYSSPFYMLDEEGLGPAPGELPKPAVCQIILRNPDVTSVEKRAYIIEQAARRDPLRPERGVEFDMLGRRHDLVSGVARVNVVDETPPITQTESVALSKVIGALPDLPPGNWKVFLRLR